MHCPAPAPDRQARVAGANCDAVDRFRVRRCLQINGGGLPSRHREVQRDAPIAATAEQYAVAMTKRDCCHMRWLFDVRDPEGRSPLARLPQLDRGAAR